MRLRGEEGVRLQPTFFKVPYVMSVTQTQALPGPTLVDLLVAAGHTEPGAKSILHRMAASDALILTRYGRVGQYRLTGRAEEEATSMLSGRRTRRPWDGQFHVVVYDIPESDRTNRIRLRTDAFAHGYAALRSGLLIAPRDNSRYFLPRYQQLDVFGGWMRLDTDDVSHLVRQAWHLDDSYPRYRAMLAHLDDVRRRDLTTLDGQECFQLLLQEVEAALEAEMLSGSLPDELLPADWPGHRLQDRLQALVDDVLPPAREHAEEIVARSAYPHLVERVCADVLS